MDLEESKAMALEQEERERRLWKTRGQLKLMLKKLPKEVRQHIQATVLGEDADEYVAQQYRQALRIKK